jgi:hypothetical protein
MCYTVEVNLSIFIVNCPILFTLFSYYFPSIFGHSLNKDTSLSLEAGSNFGQHQNLRCSSESKYPSKLIFPLSSLTGDNRGSNISSRMGVSVGMGLGLKGTSVFGSRDSIDYDSTDRIIESYWDSDDEDGKRGGLVEINLDTGEERETRTKFDEERRRNMYWYVDVNSNQNSNRAGREHSSVGMAGDGLIKVSWVGPGSPGGAGFI